MRVLSAALSLLLAVPAAAQDVYEWTGLWEGKIGNFPVRACLQGYPDGAGSGSYYYLSQLEPIQLAEDGGEDTWTERAPGAESEALWRFEQLDREHASGVWSQGRRRLPFSLSPVPWSAGDESSPCSSAEFLGPRLRGGQVETQDASLDEWTFTELHYLVPSHLVGDISITTFSFPPERPGDRAVNAALAEALPRNTVDDELFECFASNLDAQGLDGFFERTVRPTMVARAFLTVEDSASTYCGGAHPNYQTVHRTHDRETGEEIDLSEWIDDEFVDGDIAAFSRALRDLVLARWPADDENDCAEAAAETDYWSLGLARDGLIFRPDLPHVATACEEPVAVEWGALAPYLDEDGSAGLARLRDQ